MFVSTDALSIYYGVDNKIAQFFVDREPPPDNLYWKDKLMYLRFEPGYIFIPLIVDILYKLGIDRTQLLCNKFIDLMEGIGNVSALEESKKIGYNEALNTCIQLAQSAAVNDDCVKIITGYFRAETNNPLLTYTTPFKALHRGDFFLFALCALDISKTSLNEIVRHWFALISTLLLLDDAEDIEIDSKNNDENAFLEVGFTKEGVAKIRELIQSNLQLLSALNKPMAMKLDEKIKALFNQNKFQQLYN